MWGLYPRLRKRYNHRVEFRILGPLQVLDGGSELELGSPKERALLAVLLLQPGVAVGRERLIDAVWGESRPPSAAKALNVHVSHLRKALARDGDPVIATRPPGYVLEIDPEQLDATRFERLVAEAREQIASNRVPVARNLLHDALELWRGRALDGVDLEASVRHEVSRLEELRLGAEMDRIDCELALGQHERVIGDLESLLAEYPLRERLCGQYMLALYRAGRQAEALQAYQDARRVLVDTLGLEPSEPLQRLERAILNHDPALELPAGISHRQARGPSTEQRWTRSRRLVLAGSAAAVIALVAALAIVAIPSRGSVRTVPNSVAVLSAKAGTVNRSIAVDQRPASIVATSDDIWVANRASGTLSKIDSRTMRVVQTIALGGFPSSLAVIDHTVWVTDAGTDQVAAVHVGDGGGVSIQRSARPRPSLQGIGAVLIAAGQTLWTTRSWPPSLVPVERSAGKAREISLPDIPTAATADRNYMWIVSAPGATVSAINLHGGGLVAHIRVGPTPVAVAVGAGATWVATEGDDSVERIDPSVFKVTA